MENTKTIRCPDCLSYIVRYRIRDNDYICTKCTNIFKMKQSYKEK